MKLWQLAIIQLVLFGSFIYIMYSPSSNDDNFLQDTGSVVFVTHDSSSSPTNHPETPPYEDPNSTPTTTQPSTSQPEHPSSTGTPSGPSVPPREPEHPAGPDTPNPTTNSSTSQPGQGSQQPQPPKEPQQPVETTPPAPSSTDNPTVPEGPHQPTETPNTTSPPEQPPSQPGPSTEPPAPTEVQKKPWKGGAPVATPSVNSTSVKGSGEEPKIIFTSQAVNNTCHQINQRQVKLCKFSLLNNCKRYHVSEELSSFWMISPIYTANNEQTDRLYYLHGNFRNYVRSYGINFQTVEVIFPGQNEFLLTEPNNEPYDLQYHNDWIFAMRENLVNVGIKHLPDDWQYMAWIDQHIFWLDPYWFEKTILAFNKYNIVHMLNGNDFWNLHNTTDYYLEGFGRLWNQIGMGFQSHDPRQCGLAWGMRRDIFEKLGGLLDICIGTKCDLYQNYAYTGNRYTSQTGNWEYANMIGEWQDHAIKVYDRKLGYVDVKVVHFMHCTGTCKTSDYNQQIYALMQYNYNPRQNIKRDDEGRMSLINNVPLGLRLWQIYGGPPRSA